MVFFKYLQFLKVRPLKFKNTEGVAQRLSTLTDAIKIYYHTMFLKIITLILTPFFAFLPLTKPQNAEFNTNLTLANGEQITLDPGYIDNVYRIRRVCIDAGHGGIDSGCLGEGMEKKNTLAMAMLLGRKIKENYPEIEVIYTRDRDVFVELHKRAEIANKAKADLFISLHCNSTDAGTVHGTETYVLGAHKMEENLGVAKRENASILLENDYETQYEGFDPNSNEAYIIFRLFQNAYLDKSILFGKYVEESFKNNAGRRSIGVKQAGFVVLRQATMPSVLIETGFLNHPTEGVYISSAQGQDQMTDAILSAFSKYKNAVETHEGEEVARGTYSIVKNSAKRNNTAEGVEYKIQLAISDKDLSNTPRWKNVDNLEVKKESTLYKYYHGSLESYEEAQTALKKMKTAGYSGAFIVAFKNGKKVALDEVR
jgi:N-acetylmuramoyl-L-alanine amidase